MNICTTRDLIAYLLTLGFVVRDTGAVRITDAATGASCVVFVTMSPSKVITLAHPPKGGRAQTYRQRFRSIDRAVAQLRATNPN